MDLSVIIVSWNTKVLLKNCLESIYKFTKGIEFEVIVIDNGSGDGSQTMIRKQFLQVKLIANKDNRGFTKANNQGIKIAKGDFILLLNSDTRLIEDSLSMLVERASALEKGPTLNSSEENRPSNLNAKRVRPFGALGPVLLNEDRTVQQSVGFFPHLPQVFLWMTFLDDLPFGRYLAPYHMDHDAFYNKVVNTTLRSSLSRNSTAVLKEARVDWITGAAILVPRHVEEKVGALDEDIFMYGEEVDWCYRIKKAGYAVYLTPVTKIVHIGRGSHKKVTTSAYVGEFKGILHFYRKYKGSFSLQIARMLLKIGALLRIFVFQLMGRKELSRAYVEAFKVV